MNSYIDRVIYANILSLLDSRGISEHKCITACSLNSCYFSNFKKGITKHFRICDVLKIAQFLEVTLDDLCKTDESINSLFVPRYKLLSRDEKILTSAFKKLDPVGRIKAAEFINKEIIRSKERVRQQK